MTFGAITSGRSQVSDEERAAQAKLMEAAMASDGLSWERDQYELERHLPGINLFTFGTEKEERLFSQADRASVALAAKDRRLASPSHARLFFTLVAPADGVSDLDIARLLQAAGEGRESVAAWLTELHDHKGDAAPRKQSVCSINSALPCMRRLKIGQSRV